MRPPVAEPARGHRRRLIAALLAATVGFAIWRFSLQLSGRQEPWDGSFLRYCLLVAGCGAVCAWVAAPRRALNKLLFPAAFLLGEIACLAIQPDRWSLWPLALVALAFGALPAVAGVALVHRFTGVTAAK